MIPRVDASLMSRMKALDKENKRLKKMYAGKSIQNDLLKEALGKTICAKGDGRMGRSISIHQHCFGVPDV